MGRFLPRVVKSPRPQEQIYVPVTDQQQNSKLLVQCLKLFKMPILLYEWNTITFAKSELTTHSSAEAKCLEQPAYIELPNLHGKMFIQHTQTECLLSTYALFDLLTRLLKWSATQTAWHMVQAACEMAPLLPAPNLLSMVLHWKQLSHQEIEKTKCEHTAESY